MGIQVPLDLSRSACYQHLTERGLSIRVCLYTRISTDEENQPTSLHSQRERLEAFASSQEGWTVVAHHEDRATGTKLERPGLQAALDLARAGRIDLILVYRVDRLSRKVRQLAQLAEELDKSNVVLRSATEPFDTGAAAGRMMLQMLAVFAEFEHATIVDRVTAGIERRAKEGRWVNGRIPFGYTRDEQKLLVPDERTAPVVRRVFSLYTEGRLGTASLAHQLNAEQVPSPPKGWQPTVVQWVLENPAYLGRIIWRGKDYPGIHEPLIDAATFDAAQRILDERGEDCSRRRGNRSDFILSGVLRCGKCRRAYIGMSARGNGGQYHYYACSGRQKLGPKGCDGERLNRDKLEQAVLGQLTGLYRDGTLIREALTKATKEREGDRPEKQARLRSLEQETRRVEASLERYYRGFEGGTLDTARFSTRTAALEAKLEALSEERHTLKIELEVEQEAPVTDRALAGVAEELEATILRGNPEQSKALLRLLIAEIKVNGRSDIRPTYRVVTTPVCATTSSVEPAGIEPATSAMPWRRSPS